MMFRKAVLENRTELKLQKLHEHFTVSKRVAYRYQAHNWFRIYSLSTKNLNVKT